MKNREVIKPNNQIFISDIHDIEESTEIIDKYKKINSNQFWQVFGKESGFYNISIDVDKCAHALKVFNTLRKHSSYLSGKFFYEISTKIRKEFDDWNYIYYKDPSKKPQFTSLESFCNSVYEITGVSYRQAKRDMWIFLNVGINDTELGYKKNKLIEDILGEDDEIKKTVRNIVKKHCMNEIKVEQFLEQYIEKLEKYAEETGLKKTYFEEHAKKKILNHLLRLDEFQESRNSILIKKINCEHNSVNITMTRKKDAEYVRDAILELEKSIKLRAYRKKKLDN